VPDCGTSAATVPIGPDRVSEVSDDAEYCLPALFVAEGWQVFGSMIPTRPISEVLIRWVRANAACIKFFKDVFKRLHSQFDTWERGLNAVVLAAAEFLPHGG
jgi:hypothetical protein